MSDNQKQRTVTMELEKETKGTIKFHETGDVPVIGTLYVPKHTLQAMGNVRPQRIKVTIELE